jgi:toxin HigB-1
MIKTFRHKGLEAFFKTGSKAGIQAQHAAKLRILLTALDNARCPNDMNAPNWRLHALQGNLEGCYSVSVNGNWRLTFAFDAEDVELLDYLDYH